MDGDEPKVIGSQSWSQSLCQLKSRGGQPQEAAEAALCREVGEQSQGMREGGTSLVLDFLVQTPMAR